jgi:hypothetical protein
MIRVLLGFLAVELIIGFLTLMIMLTFSDLYLQEGRKLLTPMSAPGANAPPARCWSG